MLGGKSPYSNSKKKIVRDIFNWFFPSLSCKCFEQKGNVFYLVELPLLDVVCLHSTINAEYSIVIPVTPASFILFYAFINSWRGYYHGISSLEQLGIFVSDFQNPKFLTAVFHSQNTRSAAAIMDTLKAHSLSGILSWME